MEAIVALSLVAAGVFAASAVLQAGRRVEVPGEARMSLLTLAREARAAAAGPAVAYWRKLGRRDCRTVGEEAPDPALLSLSQLGLKHLDRPVLEEVLPSLRPDGTPHPLREAIDQLIAQKGDLASTYCTDPELAEDPNLSLIAQSVFNQTLCRCASARTAYATLVAPVETLATHQSFYVCYLKHAPSERGEGEGETGAEGAGSGGAPVLLELTASIVDVAEDEPLVCGGVRDLGADRALGRIHYTAVGLLPPHPRISGAYYLGDGGGA